MKAFALWKPCQESWNTSSRSFEFFSSKEMNCFIFGNAARNLEIQVVLVFRGAGTSRYLGVHLADSRSFLSNHNPWNYFLCVCTFPSAPWIFRCGCMVFIMVVVIAVAFQNRIAISCWTRSIDGLKTFHQWTCIKFPRFLTDFWPISDRLIPIVLGSAPGPAERCGCQHHRNGGSHSQGPGVCTWRLMRDPEVVISNVWWWFVVAIHGMLIQLTGVSHVNPIRGSMTVQQDRCRMNTTHWLW